MFSSDLSNLTTSQGMRETGGNERLPAFPRDTLISPNSSCFCGRWRTRRLGNHLTNRSVADKSYPQTVFQDLRDEAFWKAHNSFDTIEAGLSWIVATALTQDEHTRKP